MGGKRLKRGKAGNAAQYLTRNQAIKKLQLRLSEFRRLCILKGIHPREPKKKPQGANKTYYHVKDINFLLHEPLLNSFRNLKAYEKKIRKARAKQNEALAQRLKGLRPTYRLDHLVKERYPTFVDALRDCDDALTLVHLFASLPAEKKYEIPISAVQVSRQLALEWQAYVVRTHSLRKVFASVKGFYYQAEVMGENVTWLVPHQLAQVLPPDVDYRVMLTFLEFHHTFLKFVHFKLYTALGLRYPPLLDPKLQQAAAELAAIMSDIAGVRDEVEKQVKDMRAQLASVEEEEKASKGLRKDGKANGVKALPEKMPQQEDGSDEEEEGDDASEVDDDEAADGSDDDDDEPILDIDSGAETSDDEEDDEEEEEEGEESDDDSVEAGNGDADVSLELQVGNADRSSEGIKDVGVAAAGGALECDDERSVCSRLFSGLVFFLSREVPREPLLLVVRAFGGTVAWEGEGSPHAENSESITHQVVDRPKQGHLFLSRTYVQPQWVLDSANFRVLLPSEAYAPGKIPPPHLSPFVNDENEGYTPDYAQTIKQLQTAARAARERASKAGALGEFLEDADKSTEGIVEADAGHVDEGDDVEHAYVAELAKELETAAEADEPDEMEEEDGDEDAAPRSQKTGEHTAKVRSSKRPAAEPEDEEALADIMMSRKTRKLYGRIKRAQQGKKEAVEALETRKQRLAKNSARQ